MKHHQKMRVIKDLLMRMAIEVLASHQTMDKEVLSDAIVNSAMKKLEIIDELLNQKESEDDEFKNTCYQPKNPNESQMDRDDFQFNEGFKRGVKQGEENLAKECDAAHDFGYSKGVKDTEKKFGVEYTDKEIKQLQKRFYLEGFNDGQRQGQENIKIMREAAFQEGFEKGLASLESESKFKMEIRKRLKQLEDLLVI
jgi:hypothetical protein